jgi:hypothetical protein
MWAPQRWDGMTVTVRWTQIWWTHVVVVDMWFGMSVASNLLRFYSVVVLYSLSVWTL